MKKRLMAFLLAAIMLVGMLPLTAMAEEVAHEHDLQPVDRVEPTCKPGNYAYYWCAGCTTAFEDAEGTVKFNDGKKASTVIPAVAQHQYDEVAGTKVDPTCQKAGKEVDEKCSVCGKVKTGKEIPATGHPEWVTVSKKKAATCTEPGQDAGSYCAVCGAFVDANGVFTNRYDKGVVDAKGHTFKDVTGAPGNCKATGYTDYKVCTVKGCGYEEGYATTGFVHSLVKTEAVEATCLKEGNLEYWTCNKCWNVFASEEDAAANKVAHVADFTVVKKAHAEKVHVDGQKATCTETGWKEFDYYPCHQDAEKLKKTTYKLDLVAHDYLYVPEKAATCTEDGNTAGFEPCKVCGHVSEEGGFHAPVKIDALGHNAYRWHEAKAATCTEKGELETWYCDRDCCNNKLFFKTENGEYVEVKGDEYILPMLPHTEVEVKGYPATCLKAGKEDGTKCSVCGTVIVKQETIKALGHTGMEDGVCDRCDYDENCAHKNVKVIQDGIPATCEGEGQYALYQCKNRKCGKVYAERIDNKNGTYTYFREIKDLDGNGSYVGESIIPALGHDLVVTEEGKAPTCTETGLTAAQKCTRKGCKHVEKQEEIAALGHNGVVVEAVEATCTETGLTAGEQCDRCKIWLKAQEETPAKGHTEPNDEGKCDVCGKPLVGMFTVTFHFNAEGMEALDVVRTVKEGTPVKDVEIPTVNRDGFTFGGWYDSADCLGGDFSAWENNNVNSNYDFYAKWTENETEVPPVETECDHDGIRTIRAKDATCTEGGNTEFSYCGKCNTYFDAEDKECGALDMIVKALGHNFVEGKCTRCDAIDPDYKPEEGCKHNAPVVIEAVEATCTQYGSEAGFACPTCFKQWNAKGEEVDSLLIEMKPHTFEKGFCTVCGAEDPDYKPEEICYHNAPVVIEAVEATCTQYGSEAGFACPTCFKQWNAKGEEVDSLLIEMKPHTFEKGFCTVCGAEDPDYKPGEHKHDMVLIPGTPARCDSDGFKAAFQCKTCGKMYMDDKGEVEFSRELAIIPAGHKNLTHIPGTPARCDSDGFKDAYQCEICGKLFMDNEAKVEWTRADAIIPAGHKNLTLIPGTPAACHSDGFRDAYRCEMCDKLFMDKDAKIEWTRKLAIIPGLEHVDEDDNGFCDRDGCGADLGKPAPDMVTVFFISRGQCVGSAKVERGDNIGRANMPKDPTRGGYWFAGWNTMKDGSGKNVHWYTNVNVDELWVYATWCPVEEGNPKTGDTIMMWVGILAVAGAGLAGAAYVTSKKKRG